MGKATVLATVSVSNTATTTMLSFNVNDTMENIRYLMKKYEWMAADIQNKGVLRKDKDLPPQTELTEEEMDRMAALYKQGMAVKQIAVEVKRSAPSVYWALKEKKVFKGKQSKTYTVTEKKRLIDLAKQEKNLSVAAKKYNVTHKALKRWIEQYEDK